MTPQLIMIFGGGLFLIILLFVFGSGNSDGLEKKRLARVGGDSPIKNDPHEQKGSLRRETTASSIPLFDRLIKATLPNPEKLRQRLMAAGFKVTLGTYLLINGLSIGVFYLVFAFYFEMASLMAFFLGIAAGLFFPHKVVGRKINKRLKKFTENFPEAIDTMCRGLRAGMPIAETISTVGQELPDPIGIEFQRISDNVKMGRSLEDSMWEVAPRLNTPEYRFFIIALAIQRETGGNLAETLGNLADLLRKRRQLKLKIKAMSSEARASAMIIGSLPFLMFALLYVVNAEYVMILLHDARGNVILGAGLGWLTIGIFVMKQMISFEI